MFLFFCQETLELALLAPLFDLQSGACFGRDTSSVDIYITLLGLGVLR